MFLALINKLFKWSNPTDSQITSCFLKLCNFKDFNTSCLCAILIEHKELISSNVMKALLKLYLERQNEDMCLTLFNMCINNVFPKLENKDIDFPSDQMRKLLIIQAQKMYINYQICTQATSESRIQKQRTVRL